MSSLVSKQTYLNFLKVFKNTDKTWNVAVSELKKLSETINNIMSAIDGVNENNCIIKYCDEKFEIISLPDYASAIGGEPDYDFVSINEFVEKEKFEKIFYPIFSQYLDGIKSLSGQQNLSGKAVYFLVRISGGELKRGVAEAWHHDYMWAPASYSSIIYLTAGDAKLTTANFCKWNFNKSGERKFGTDIYGPGIGSIFIREEVYMHYKNFLIKYRENDYRDYYDKNVLSDTKNQYGHTIAIRLSKNRVINAKIVKFDIYQETEYIYFTLEPYSEITQTFLNKLYKGNLNEFLYGKGEQGATSLSSYNISIKEKLNFGPDGKINNKTVYKVKFNDWDINWKLRLGDVNPGSIGYNLLVGPDIYNKLLLESTENHKNSLIYLYFGKPLYDEYMSKKSLEISGCPNDLYVEKIDGLELLEGVMWDNKNTWHRSPFIPKEITDTVDGLRHFINIRMVVVDKNINEPFKVKDRDFSQLSGGFYQKYLKYKTKYLSLKKKLTSN